MSIVHKVCKAMERIAPLRLAEKWDNVGLLIESPFTKHNGNRVLLTIDLTPAVLAEALTSTLNPTSLIISYHPPIFKPITSLTSANPLQSSLLQCVAQGISVYSPHTAIDSMWGGVNDWLAEGIVGAGSSSQQIGVVKALGVQKLGAGDEQEGAEGRLVELREPMEMKELEKRIRKHLKLSQIQVGYGTPTGIYATQPIRTIAICAGAGGSMFAGVGKKADVYFTGEMAHHEVLAAVATGTHVILCGHTNTERGYLPVLASKLARQLEIDLGARDLVEIRVSQQDRHPLQFSKE